MTAEEPLLEPVEAYDRIASAYSRLVEQKIAYLNSIDELVISHIPPKTKSLLDVGAGDGRRAFLIAQRAGISKIALLEPSAGMRRTAPPNAEIWPLRAEQVDASGRTFDVITCLWNVLGHIHEVDRVRALSKLANLLAPRGKMFVDVNHRCNAASYGWFHTAMRWVYDCVWPDQRHGDVAVRWDLDTVRCATFGHVFTDREFRTLAESAGLRIDERIVVDYSTGRIRRFAFTGNLLYVLRRE